MASGHCTGTLRERVEVAAQGRSGQFKAGVSFIGSARRAALALIDALPRSILDGSTSTGGRGGDVMLGNISDGVLTQDDIHHRVLKIASTEAWPPRVERLTGRRVSTSPARTIRWVVSGTPTTRIHSSRNSNLLLAAEQPANQRSCLRLDSTLLIRARNDRTRPELMAGPRLQVPDAHRPAWTVSRRAIVEFPLQAAALAGAIGGSHCSTIRTDSDEHESGCHEKRNEDHRQASAARQLMGSHTKASPGCPCRPWLP